MGRGEKAAFFVVTDGGGVEIGAAGEMTDFHFWILSFSRVALKPLPRGCGTVATVKAAAGLPQSKAARLRKRDLQNLANDA
jgi:hypothetical protein